MPVYGLTRTGVDKAIKQTRTVFAALCWDGAIGCTWAGARGEKAANLLSLMITCKRLGVEPYAYLHDILRRLPSHPNKDIRQLTPRAGRKRSDPNSRRRNPRLRPPPPAESRRDPQPPSSYICGKVAAALGLRAGIDWSNRRDVPDRIHQ